MIEPTVETIKADVCAFVAWVWEHGEYQLANLSRFDADTMSDVELLKLITEFAYERAAHLRAESRKILC